MSSVYMGFFSSIFEAIFNAIIMPVIKFIASLVTPVLTWLFQEILRPLLVNVFFPLLKTVGSLVIDTLSDVLYEILIQLLKILEYVQKFFDIFCGISPVTYNGKEYSFLEMLFVQPTIRRSVFGIMGAAFVLLILFSGIATLRSLVETGAEIKRPVTKVLHDAFSGFVKMVLIPFTCLFLVLLSGQVMKSISEGLTRVREEETADGKGNSKTTLSRVIFTLTTLDASKNKSYNISSLSYQGGANENYNDLDVGLMDSVRAPYYYSNYTGGSRDYTSLDVVKNDFEIKDLDFTLGYAIGLLLLYVLALACFSLIGRIINVIVLYVVSPLFAASIPLDEGKKYEGWKERFVGELFNGLGAMIAMQVYLTLIPVIMNSKLTFGEGTVEANALIRIIFLLGGAWAVKDAGRIVTGFISQQAASDAAANEASTMAFTMGVGSWAGAAAMSFGSYLGGKMFGGGGKDKDKDKNKDGEGEGEEGKGGGQKFSGKK